MHFLFIDMKLYARILSFFLFVLNRTGSDNRNILEEAF